MKENGLWGNGSGKRTAGLLVSEFRAVTHHQVPFRVQVCRIVMEIDIRKRDTYHYD